MYLVIFVLEIVVHLSSQWLLRYSVSRMPRAPACLTPRRWAGESRQKKKEETGTQPQSRAQADHRGPRRRRKNGEARSPTRPCRSHRRRSPCAPAQTRTHTNAQTRREEARERGCSHDGGALAHQVFYVKSAQSKYRHKAPYKANLLPENPDAKSSSRAPRKIRDS